MERIFKNYYKNWNEHIPAKSKRFKKRIKYILDTDDYLHIRKIFGHLITKGFVIKKKNRASTRYCWNPFSLEESLLVSSKIQTFN